MTGDKERGDAVADKWRDTFDKNRRETDNALTRLDVRSDMKSFGEEEDSAVIDQRALEAQTKREGSIPAPARGIRVVLTAVDSWQKVAALLILVAGLLAGYWLKSR